MSHSFNKVPAVTLAFWLIKIAATTMGETAGDAVSMTLELGYLASSCIFALLFVVAASAQIFAQRYHPFLYWGVIVATTTLGTTLADFSTRSLGVGYPGGSLILFALVLLSLAAWHFSVGRISFDHIASPKVESFYWMTILFSNTLGTALGDFLADETPLGYEGGALIFGAVLALIAAAYYFSRVSRALLFWMAFILTRPLGATLGDILTKPLEAGGLDLGRFSSSAVLAAVMTALILYSLRKAKTAHS
ncbi:MAG: hypothetical protein EBV03_08005 [Proteobacteria bacterium]|nr:hypothetical protein [Pseudomonadota bacterium]